MATHKLDITDFATRLIYKNVSYRSAKELLDLKLYISIGCKTVSELIKKYSIKDYMYVRYDKSIRRWRKSDGNAKSVDRLMIKKQWLIDNVPEYSTTAKYQYDYLPPILELRDDEKFTNANGKIVYVEIRGTRDYNNCYFRITDIDNLFGGSSLNGLILKKDGGYKKNIHYKYFLTQNKNRLPALFITYLGLIKIILTSKNERIARYIPWVVSGSFTTHFGNIDDRQQLAAQLCGIGFNNLHALLSTKTCASKISCIYFIFLETVGNLREEMQIPDKYTDDMIVAKYGRSGNLKSRMYGHSSTFRKMVPSAKLELLHFSFIDAENIVLAENDLSAEFSGFKYKWNDTKEILIINKKDMTFIKQTYSKLCSKYCVTTKKANDCVSALKKQIDDMESQHKIQTKDIQLELLASKMETKDIKIDLLTAKLETKDIRAKFDKLEREFSEYKLKCEQNNV